MKLKDSKRKVKNNEKFSSAAGFFYMCGVARHNFSLPKDWRGFELPQHSKPAKPGFSVCVQPNLLIKWGKVKPYNAPHKPNTTNKTNKTNTKQ